jgi:PIN domain nuclease of toxin-antitoxin system
VTVLDAYAVLAYFRAETAADAVAELLRQPTILSSVNAAEVIDQLVRVYERDGDDVHADLALLANDGLTIEPVSADVGLQAGHLRAKYHHRERMAVSMADCVAAATALANRRPLATSDPALARLVRAEEGRVHGLPDSNGTLP